MINAMILLINELVFPKDYIVSLPFILFSSDRKTSIGHAKIFLFFFSFAIKFAVGVSYDMVVFQLVFDAC